MRLRQHHWIGTGNFSWKQLVPRVLALSLRTDPESSRKPPQQAQPKNSLDATFQSCRNVQSYEWLLPSLFSLGKFTGHQSGCWNTVMLNYLDTVSVAALHNSAQHIQQLQLLIYKAPAKEKASKGNHCINARSLEVSYVIHSSQLFPALKEYVVKKTAWYRRGSGS